MEAIAIDDLEQIKDAPLKADVKLIKATPPAMKRPTFTYRLPAYNSRREDGDGFYPAEYDFIDIGLAEDTESFIYQANFKKLALAIKAGWQFVSRSQESLDYIRRRIAEIEIAQGQTFWALMVEILATMLRYHNCFLVKARDVEKSSGKVRTIDEKKIKPIAGYFVVSPETMLFKIGKDYRIKAYKHIMPDGREKIFQPEDVIHFHIYRKTHHLAGTPAWIPVLDDVTALRRIEEHVENLVYQHLYPLFQYKVGNKDFPMERYEDGTTEVDVVRAKIEEMPTDGILVTPDRHEIEGLGSEGKALSGEKYLEYFKKRVITGTGLSSIDFGDGNTSNRSTSDTMSKLAIDNVKFYQASMANDINFEIVRELMLESTFNYDHTNDEMRVELQFNEVDLENQIKLQNHYMLMYQGHAFTEGEARKHIGKEPLTDEQREDAYLNRIEKPKAEWQAQAAIDKAKATAQNRQQPTNQHGKKSGPSKRKSSIERDGVAEQVYSQLAEDIHRIGPQINIGFIRQLFLATADRAKRFFSPEIRNSVIRGTQGYLVTENLRLELDSITRRLTRELEDDVDRLFRDANTRTTVDLINGERESLGIDALQYRIRFIERTLTHKAYILSKVASMRASGLQKAIVQSDPEGEDYETWHNIVIDLNNIDPNNLPPFHPGCRCDVEPGDMNV